MTNSRAKVAWIYLLFLMLNSKLNRELPFFFFPAFLFVKVREASEFWRGGGSTFPKIQ